MFSSMGWLNRTAYQCLVMIPKIWNSKLLHFLLKKKQKATQFRFNYLKTIEIFAHEILNYILDEYM